MIAKFIMPIFLLSLYSIEIKDPGEGCGDFYIYKELRTTKEGTEFINVDCDRKKVKLSERFSIFNISNINKKIVNIYIDLNEKGKIYNSGCSDMFIANAAIPIQWQAISGNVKIAISKPDNNGEYFVNVILENCLFESKIKKNRIFVKKFYFNNIKVGHFAG